MQGRRIWNDPIPRRYTAASDWVILSRDADSLEQLEAFVRERRPMHQDRPMVRIGKPRPELLPTFPLWTDEYSNVFGVLKSKRKTKRRKKP